MISSLILNAMVITYYINVLRFSMSVILELDDYVEAHPFNS